MTWLDGNMVLTEDMIVYRFGEGDPIEYKPGDHTIFNVEIRDPETGKLDDGAQWLDYGVDSPTISACKRETKMVWRLTVCPTREGESYQNMRKRLILIWDRIMMPEVDREYLKKLADDFVEVNGLLGGTPIIPYRDPSIEV